MTGKWVPGIRVIALATAWVGVLLPPADAAGQGYQVDLGRENRVRFVSNAPLEDFEGVTDRIDGFLFFSGEDGLTLVLTRRTDTVEHHRSQISFPGGARENGEPLVETALREVEEEIGIPPNTVEVLGEMVPMSIPVSGFVVHPFVGATPERPEYRIDPVEVAGIIEAPLSHLLDRTRRREEEQVFRGRRVMVPFFDLPNVDRPPLWGATAMMLSGLIERLRVVLHSKQSESPSE